MADFTSKVDKSDPQNPKITLLDNTGGEAGTVMVSFATTPPQLESFSINANSRGHGLSYALILVGAIEVLQQGFTSFKTGMVHGVLHDTMHKAGMTAGVMMQDPTVKNRHKTAGPGGSVMTSNYLTANNLPQHSMCIWTTTNVSNVIATCMTKMMGLGVGISPAK